MNQLCTRLLGIAMLGTLLATAPGCVLNNSDVVIQETVCVTLDEYQTTGTFESFVVCDQFKAALLAALEANNMTLSDVRRISMKSGSFQTSNVTPHDWNVTADINIARQDVVSGPFDDGPAAFVSFTNQSLEAIKLGAPAVKLNQTGVNLVNRALESLLAGEDPRLVLLVENEAVVPTPSVSDPLQFTLEACVEFQAVVRKKK
jgi:hypothetical protein